LHGISYLFVGFTIPPPRPPQWDHGGGGVSGSPRPVNG